MSVRENIPTGKPGPCLEPAREIPVQENYDVIVSGGGPAGIAAALAAARAGAKTCLIEAQGCLGGVWTSGLLSLILDGRDKPGITSEIRGRLLARGAMSAQHGLYDAEEMKVLIEEMCVEAAVDIRLQFQSLAASAGESEPISGPLRQARRRTARRPPLHARGKLPSRGSREPGDRT